jgi:hypothetical protein
MEGWDRHGGRTANHGQTLTLKMPLGILRNLRPSRFHMRTPLVRALVLPLIACAFAACRSAPRANTVALNPNLLVEAEITRARAEGVRDLYELISRTRPRWLDVRQDRSLRLETSIVVYQNNSRLGGIDALRGYALENIASIRYLDSAQAGQLPGAGGGHIEGAIVISTGQRKQ